ncbi:hypothetical protein HFP51_12010 [Parasphingopyxis sp. CP4]|uniref:hypothetical protein n=1 Tax=Parasphingopyxis sp. CP4 TaxID=2724527 RepID=UPI0015A38E15|nr:hypothetical protein [Parasphingopyxis sp. CP4]QLC22842.1 hypothetical protein HFP51_12010 [Parasphingopyxis sp. CP4]
MPSRSFSPIAPERGLIIAQSGSSRTLSRRSFLSRVVGGTTLAVGAGSVVTGCKDPEGDGAQAGLTDCDGGPNADPAGGGRTGGNTGVSDSDGGANADPAGCGNGEGPITDSDRGRFADPVAQGRGTERQTDRDVGFGADPIGRGTGEPTASSIDDGDSK